MIAESQPHTASLPEIEPLQLRQVLGTFVTGVTIITTIDERGQRHGLTVNSFSSVSLEPPLILWSQSRHAPSHEVFQRSRYFAVNILAEHQADLSQHFARPARDKFAELKTRAGLGGVPLIDDCSAYLECEVADILPGGDHRIFLGRVLRMARQEHSPLIYGRGRYHRAHPLPAHTP